MKRIGLTGRIWLSLGVFVAGYLLSVAVSQTQGMRAEGRLVHTSAALFPVAQQTQQAEASFERMTRGFSDAVILEDASAIDKAVDAGKEVATLLDSAAKAPGLDSERARKLKALADQVRTIANDGKTTYTAMLGAGGTMTEQMQEQMRALASATDGAKSGLVKMREQTATDLRNELSNAVSGSVQQRWLNAGVFVMTMVIAGVFVFFTIRRAVVGVLRSVVFGLREGAAQIASAASQVASSAQSLSQGSNEQASAVHETSASLEHMAEMTRHSAKHAAEAATLVAQVHGLVDDSNRALKEMVVSMSSIEDSSHKVAKIIKTIDEIAFQTNILALNAAVEAARAGEAGMGFAVVADEVRTLAQRSAQAARDTAALIEESIGNTERGRDRVQVVVSSVTAITSNVDKVKHLVDEVSSSTREQAHGIDQVTAAVAKIGQVTQTTAATAEESAAASEELNAQAETAMSEVARLAELVGDQGSRSRSRSYASDVYDDESEMPVMPASRIVPLQRPPVARSQAERSQYESTGTGGFGNF
jgi:methyl-accepting chemotaxis protein